MAKSNNNNKVKRGRAYNRPLWVAEQSKGRVFAVDIVSWGVSPSVMIDQMKCLRPQGSW